ncbi:MAG: hypothetical protein U1E60_06305 [Reyranellaceae bacterium]
MSGLSLQFQPTAATAILGGLVPSRVAHRPGWFTEIPLALQAWRELRRIRMATCPWSGCRHYTSVFSILPNGQIGEPIVGWAGNIEQRPTQFWWDVAPWCWMTTRFIVSTSGENQTDNVPSAWNNGNNTIEVIGGGAGARNATSSFNNYGGGGGAYAKSVNVSLAPGGTATFYIGPAALGGAATSTPGVDNPGQDGAWNFYNGTYYGDASVWAAGGTSADGAGGTDGGGSVLYLGGNGAGIGGGGGAGGSNGAGANSVVSSTAFTVSDGGNGGSGGGGNGGGSDGVVNVRKDGGNGGDNSGSTGHGSGATSGASAADGTNGGGGGGGYGSTTVYRDAAAGGVGTEWDGSHGGGGGGGCGAIDGRNSTTSRSNGGNGGNYGGGGGTGGSSFSSSFTTWRSGGSGGNGGQGIIVMVYVPVTFAGFNRAPRMTYLRR